MIRVKIDHVNLISHVHCTCNTKMLRLF